MGFRFAVVFGLLVLGYLTECISPQTTQIKTRGSSVSFALQTQSFLWGKFSSARLQILPNLRYARVFQMSTTVNLEIGLTRPGVKLDKKMSIYSSTLQHGDILPANSSLLEGDVKVRKCHAMLFLRTCMSRKWM